MSSTYVVGVLSSFFGERSRPDPSSCSSPSTFERVRSAMLPSALWVGAERRVLVGVRSIRVLPSLLRAWWLESKGAVTRTGQFVFSRFVASSLSMIFWKVVAGWAPTICRPLMKKVGVPVMPS